MADTIKSTEDSTKHGVIVLNPDGSNISGSSGGDGAIVDGVSSSIKASVLDYTNSKPVAVRLTNTDGDYVDATSLEQDGTALTNTQINVDTTVGGVSLASASAGRHGIDITNQGSVGCYVGTGTVSASNGYYLGPGESLFLPTDSEVKAITSSSSTTVGVLLYA